MFLPVLLFRDFGPWSFAVFAIPNVIGASLMGAVLERKGASEDLVRRHGKACWAFSFVTLSFQVFFLCWMILGLEGSVSRWVLAPMLLVILFTGRADLASSWARFISTVVLSVSLGAGAWWLRTTSPAVHLQSPRLAAHDLIWLAPVCALGFGLCPYLDLTFHTARQRAAGRAGTIAFALGFGVFFLAMIPVGRWLSAHELRLKRCARDGDRRGAMEDCHRACTVRQLADRIGLSTELGRPVESGPDRLSTHRADPSVGPTCVYAFVQNVGVVKDHIHGCVRSAGYSQPPTDARRAA